MSHTYVEKLKRATVPLYLNKYRSRRYNVSTERRRPSPAFFNYILETSVVQQQLGQDLNE